MKGALVTRARFREGARVTVTQHDDRPPVEIAPDVEAAVLAGIRAVEEGKTEPVEKLRGRISRHRSSK